MLIITFVIRKKKTRRTLRYHFYLQLPKIKRFNTCWQKWGKRYSHIPYQLLRDNKKTNKKTTNHSGLRKNRCLFLYHVHAHRVREPCSSSSRVHHGSRCIVLSSSRKILSCVEWKMDPWCFTTFWQNGAERGTSWDWRFPPSPHPGLSSLGRRGEGRVRQERTSDWWQFPVGLRHLCIDQR